MESESKEVHEDPEVNLLDLPSKRIPLENYNLAPEFLELVKERIAKLDGR